MENAEKPRRRRVHRSCVSLPRVVLRVLRIPSDRAREQRCPLLSSRTANAWWSTRCVCACLLSFSRTLALFSLFLFLLLHAPPLTLLFSSFSFALRTLLLLLLFLMMMMMMMMMMMSSSFINAILPRFAFFPFSSFFSSLRPFDFSLFSFLFFFFHFAICFFYSSADTYPRGRSLCRTIPPRATLHAYIHTCMHAYIHVASDNVRDRIFCEGIHEFSSCTQKVPILGTRERPSMAA